jgi:hypothetical protein
MNLVMLDRGRTVTQGITPARFIVAGFVRTVERATHLFIMKTFEWVEGGSHTDELTTEGIIECLKEWPDPARRMPSPNSFISFSRPLLYFHQDHTVLSVDTITYIAQDVALLSVKASGKHCFR